jgi:hypothetical protein
MKANPYQPPDSELDKPATRSANPAFWSVVFAGIIIGAGLMNVGEPTLTKVGGIVVAVGIYWMVTNADRPSANS